MLNIAQRHLNHCCFGVISPNLVTLVDQTCQHTLDVIYAFTLIQRTSNQKWILVTSKINIKRSLTNLINFTLCSNELVFNLTEQPSLLKKSVLSTSVQKKNFTEQNSLQNKSVHYFNNPYFTEQPSLLNKSALSISVKNSHSTEQPSLLRMSPLGT